MHTPVTPKISSFVIRFVFAGGDPATDEQIYRGNIRHVQSNQELPFSHWEEAVAFIKHFVPLVDDDRGYNTPPTQPNFPKA